MNNIFVVADAGPLIAFGRLNLLSVLVKTLGAIVVPESVVNECMKDKSRPGANAIDSIIQDKIIAVHADPVTDQYNQLRTLLGPGESAAITLAVELSAGLLLDEKLARGAAKQLNLKVIGTVGVLLLAKQKNIISAVLPLIQQLKKAGYYLSDSLISEAAKISHENE